ncbi:MAG: riboflavin biosynthesis protein RibF [Planctomycetaceae bacterium]|nr:riboflavin biosynthesis protein RibF [Planctomycetaceae bacterium]
MRIQQGFEDSAGYRGGCLSIGNFDGVHRGHQRMLQSLVAESRRLGAPAVAMTFEPHPIQLLAPERAPPRLTTPERKAELIAACGVDCLIQVPTDVALLNLTAAEFFDQIVRTEINAAAIIEGPNFCFGRGRAGTTDVLRAFCEQSRIDLTIVEAVASGNTLVSSSGIRQAISGGRMFEAVSMLGRPYRLTGTVSRGAGRGVALGFGTANLEQIATLLPGDGVYAGVAEVDGERYAAAVNCGPNPTFGEHARKIEAHLIEFPSRELYGDRLSVDLIDRVRDTRKFAGVDALQSQLVEDVARAAELARPYFSGG